jgi:hypothetical protein
VTLRYGRSGGYDRLAGECARVYVVCAYQRGMRSLMSLGDPLYFYGRLVWRLCFAVSWLSERFVKVSICVDEMRPARQPQRSQVAEARH